MAVHAIVNDAFSPDNYMSHNGIPFFNPICLTPLHLTLIISSLNRFTPFYFLTNLVQLFLWRYLWFQKRV